MRSEIIVKRKQLNNFVKDHQAIEYNNDCGMPMSTLEITLFGEMCYSCYESIKTRIRNR